MDTQTSVNHLSYKKHRKQFWLQIFLPLLLVILLIVTVAVLMSLSAFGGSGDSPRWAAISTIWLVIPVMLFGVLVLAALVGLVYLMARALQGIPPYTSLGQHYANLVTDKAKQISDMAVKPVLFLQGITASMKAFLGKYS